MGNYLFLGFAGLVIFAFILIISSRSTKQDDNSMKITRILVNSNQDSYFEDSKVETNDLRPLGRYSSAYPVKDLYFRQSLKGTYDFHPAPQKQYIIYLSGEVEITTSTGRTKTFNAGDVLLVEDTYGKGHKSTILKDGRALVITMQTE